MHKAAGALRTIGEVSQLVGVAPHVLRYWETQFTQLAPVKRPDGRRYYRPDDLCLAAGLVELLREDGMTTRGAQKQLAGDKGALLRERGRARLPDLISNSVPPKRTAAREDGPVGDVSSPLPDSGGFPGGEVVAVPPGAEPQLRKDGVLHQPSTPDSHAADAPTPGNAREPLDQLDGAADERTYRPSLPELDMYPAAGAVCDATRPMPQSDTSAHRLQRLQAAARQLRGQPLRMADLRAVMPSMSALHN